MDFSCFLGGIPVWTWRIIIRIMRIMRIVRWCVAIPLVPEAITVRVMFVRTRMSVDTFLETLYISAFTTLTLEVSLNCDLAETNFNPSVIGERDIYIVSHAVVGKIGSLVSIATEHENANSLFDGFD
jgi:hypothetical protein